MKQKKALEARRHAHLPFWLGQASQLAFQRAELLILSLRPRVPDRSCSLARCSLTSQLNKFKKRFFGDDDLNTVSGGRGGTPCMLGCTQS